MINIMHERNYISLYFHYVFYQRAQAKAHEMSLQLYCYICHVVSTLYRDAHRDARDDHFSFSLSPPPLRKGLCSMQQTTPVYL